MLVAKAITGIIREREGGGEGKRSDCLGGSERAWTWSARGLPRCADCKLYRADREKFMLWWRSVNHSPVMRWSKVTVMARERISACISPNILHAKCWRDFGSRTERERREVDEEEARRAKDGERTERVKRRWRGSEREGEREGIDAQEGA